MTDVVPFPHTETGGALDLHEDDRRRLNALYRECQRIANSKFVPDAYKGDADTIFALARYGEQYGLSPMHALGRLYIIQGRIEPSYDVLLGVVMSHGHEVRVEETSSERCTVALRRDDSDFWQRLTFTIADARRAGLLDVWVEDWVKTQTGKNYKKEYTVGSLNDLGEPAVDDELVAAAPDWARPLIEKREFKYKDNWRRHPDDMLASKAIRRAAKRFCPDALLNLADEGDGMPVEQLVSRAEPDDGWQERRAEEPPARDDDIVDAEIVDAEIVEGDDDKVSGGEDAGDREASGRPEAEATEEEASISPESADQERRDKLQRQVMATATKAFPKKDGLLPAAQKARLTALRHAVTYVALKEFKSANDMTVGELQKVLARLEDIVERRLRIDEREPGMFVAVQGDRELPIPPETQAEAAA